MNCKRFVNSWTTLLVITGLLFAAYSCDSTDDNWLATIYPSKDDLANNYHLGTYKALATCRRAGQYQLEKNGWGETGTYECGLNCSLDVYADKKFICEDTAQ